MPLQIALDWSFWRFNRYAGAEGEEGRHELAGEMLSACVGKETDEQG